MANGTLSGYFEKQKKGDATTGGVSPYSVGVDAASSNAPSGGGPSAPSSAPKAAAGGGTGFVSFGQYFGANAPAIQQQAQQATTGKTRTELGVLQQPGGYAGGSAFDQMLAGGAVRREAAAKESQLDAQAAARQKYLDEMAAQQSARNQAVQQQYDTRQQYIAEEPPESRKSRSRPAGSRFDGYFNE